MMRLKNTFQLIGIVTTVFLFANFISWLIWGLDEVPELTANCITDCVFSTPDSVFILNFENSDLKVLEGSIISFNDKEREELMNTLNILFFNRPQKYINKDKIQIYGYGIKTFIDLYLFICQLIPEFIMVVLR